MKNRIIISVILFSFIFSGTVPAQVVTVPGQTEETPALIDLDVKDMAIGDVLRLLAEQGAVNIVSSRNVQGRVTAKMQDVTVEQALEAILDANNYIYRLDHEVIKVFTPQDMLQQEQTKPLMTRVFALENANAADLRQVLNSVKSARGRVEINSLSNQVIVTDTEDILEGIARSVARLDSQLDTRVFNLSYGKAQEMHTKLKEVITKEEGEIFIDERTNSLVVEAAPKMVAKIEALVQNWDKRSSQVLIEARIMEISLDKSRGLGIDWEYAGTGDDALNFTSSLPLNTATGGILKIGTLTQDQYEVTLQALETSTNTNVLSNPRIVVVDNTEANILVGSAEPYLVTYIDKETNTLTEETKFINVGVKLIVTPNISKDGYVTMKIHPEVSSARRVAEVNNALAVDTTQADTTVVVKDGRTIVLGGLIKDSDSIIESKVPILGDIPLLKYLFRSKVKSKVKKEIVVFITPHIVKQNNGLIETAERERALQEALEKAGDTWNQWENSLDVQKRER